MTISVYKKTARKSAKGKMYALGRRDGYHGTNPEFGGYAVFVVQENYDGKVRGGIRKSLAVVAQDLSFEDAVDLINKRLGRKEFKREPFAGTIAGRRL